jgi:signal peptidase I
LPARPVSEVNLCAEERRLQGGELVELVRACMATGGALAITATGSSMAPFIRAGDVVTLHALTRPPRMGDVVAASFPDGAQLVIHRVVGRGARGLRVKGDATSFEDGWFEQDQVLARVAKVERLGRPVRWGLGRERWAIAALSRARLLPPLGRAVRALRGLVRRFGGSRDPLDGS